MIISQRSEGRVAAAALRPGRHETALRGVPITFPFPPYPLQLTFMASMLEALQGMQHALLESPTGTGKTLALLTAALAYQHKVRAEAVWDICEREAYVSHLNAQRAARDRVRAEAAKRQLAARKEAGGMEGEYYSVAPESLEEVVAEEATYTAAVAATKVPRSIKGPIIFYASRTHSQLSQVVKELSKCAYYVRGENHPFPASIEANPIPLLKARFPGVLPVPPPFSSYAWAAGGGWPRCSPR
jgi:hypothetical protein